ncbi:VWA domain-containing protein [Spiroplasma endosymbiont of Virgichneumon dumeticola]|uniref:VWA domain-containing protein n=1 Tax=Spiroplasma endosymbiont of Virgichneumon dumeticola TaxID=3139323 RepID=UPI0035C9246E
MEQLIETQVSKKMASKLNSLALSETNLSNFIWFKKHFSWLAKEFDDQISNFYLNDVLAATKNVPISPIIKQEIRLYFWVKVNGLTRLKNNWQEIFIKAKKINSGIINYFHYYQDKLQERKINGNLIFNDFTMRWESLIIERVINYKLFETTQIRQKYLAMWGNNIKIINETRSLIGFAWNFFGRFWEGNLNDFKKINLNTLIQYGEILKQNPAIIEIARMLGRWKGTSDLTEKQVHEKIQIEYEMKPLGKWPEEVVGITEGRDLEHLLPLELVNLAIPELNAIFYKKFVEEKLAITEFESMDLVATEHIVKEIIEVPIPESEGPFILCIDTSKSMANSPEIIAKSIALAITKIALLDKRPCYMINFSGIFETYDLSSVASSIPNLIHFLGHSFKGQTNINPAFSHALTVMQTKEYRNCDLLLISDFLGANISNNNFNIIQSLKVKGNRFHAINIASSMLNNNWKKYFTNYWYYDPRDPFAARKIALNLSQNKSRQSK